MWVLFLRICFFSFIIFSIFISLILIGIINILDPLLGNLIACWLLLYLATFIVFNICLIVVISTMVFVFMFLVSGLSIVFGFRFCFVVVFVRNFIVQFFAWSWLIIDGFVWVDNILCIITDLIFFAVCILVVRTIIFSRCLVGFVFTEFRFIIIWWCVFVILIFGTSYLVLVNVFCTCIFFAIVAGFTWVTGSCIEIVAFWLIAIIAIYTV